MEGNAVENHEAFRNQPVNLAAHSASGKIFVNLPVFSANFFPSEMTVLHPPLLH
jgi:hypothetical protein